MTFEEAEVKGIISDFLYVMRRVADMHDEIERQRGGWHSMEREMFRQKGLADKKVAEAKELTEKLAQAEEEIKKKDFSIASLNARIEDLEKNETDSD